MKVLHVIPSVSRFDGGPSNAIWRMVDSLPTEVEQSKFESTILTTDYEQTGTRIANTAGIAQSPNAQLVCLPLTFFTYKVSLRAFLWLLGNIRRYDVVHTHAMFSFLPMAAALIARAYKVPYIMRPLGTLNAYGLSQRRPFAKRISIALLERPLLRRAFAVHCTSEAEVKDVLDICPHADTAVIPLSVESFDPASEDAVRALLGARFSAPVVLYLSRLDPKKNIEVLLAAATILVDAGKRFTLLIAGDGETAYVASLHALATRLGLDEYVLWAGRVDGEKKAAALSCASVFVLPSYTENFGIAAAEALAAGIPCVLSPGVAISAEVRASGAGLVVEPTAESFATAIARLLDDDALRARARGAARKLAAAQFSQTAMGERLRGLYVSALK
jgi:glycosyltransferase involved in cell wall biosynthesis